MPFASAVVVAVAPPLSVTVAPAVLLAGVSVPEMLRAGGLTGAAAEEVTPVLPHPAHRIRATATKRHKNPV